MKWFKRNFIVWGLLVIFMFFPSDFTLANSNQVNGKWTDVEIEILESKDDGKKDDDVIDKETVYTPSEPIPRRILPDTGEIITSFIYILIGLSLLLFLFGLLISRMIQNDIRWDY